jgi:hypothetical protein
MKRHSLVDRYQWVEIYYYLHFHFRRIIRAGKERSL